MSNETEPEITSDYDFKLVFEQLAMVARLARMIPAEHVQRFVTDIGRSETVGPFMDPTGYRAAEKRLELMKNIGNGFLKFKHSLPTLDEAHAADDLAHRVMELAGRPL
jgi:hypothetical protein